MLEPRRRDADDGERTPREIDRAADDGGIGAEPPLPDAVAEDHTVGVARPLIVPRERPAEHHPPAEQLEVAGGHEQPLEVLRRSR
jgi:hypothetical protein